MFSVLGRREIAGRSGTILEGESGANDPVGIALMASLLTTGQTAGLDAVGSIASVFLLQLAVGAVVGVAGGRLLVGFMRRLPVPSEGLYPLRVLAGALVIYGAATVAHGSGFLAEFIAEIIAGDARAPYKGEIERFHAALASLAEIVASIALGLTVGLHTLPDSGAWGIGLTLAVVLAEKRMFGGLAFLVYGNMACGVRGDDLIVRLAADAAESVQGEPGVGPFDLTSRPMKGWLLVAADRHAEDDDLRRWVDRGVAYAASLPPKAP